MTFSASPVFKFHKYYNTKSIRQRFFSDNKWNVLFFGTDNFSLFSLEQVYKKYISGNTICKLEVVTNHKTKRNVVHKFAEQSNLITHNWPLQPLLENKFDIGIVVSFGHLIPESVIKLFPLGILNVHASLLPRWRGAAPIVHSLLHGDTKTGVTIMRIQPKHFDIGDIIMQREVAVNANVLQPELHDKLAALGAEALIQCLDTLPECLHDAKPQDENNVTYAPKITQCLGIIKWRDKTAHQLCNLSRALYGIYPLQTSFRNQQVKLHQLHIWREDASENSDSKLPGHFKYIRRKKVIRVWCQDGSSVYFDYISVPGKKPMSALDFRNGFLKHLDEMEHYFTSDNLLREKDVIKSKL